MDDGIIDQMDATIEFIALPPPQRDLQFPLMRALEKRRTVRKWQDKPVLNQDLSNLLWAACGITKEQTSNSKSKRTAPSACNAQEIRVYVLMDQGVYVYDEPSHHLILVHPGDERENIGTQKMMKSAPLGLVFVADLSRMSGPRFKNKEAQRLCAWVDTGFVSQNIYLYCAAARLGTAVLALINRDKLRLSLRLQEHEQIVLTQVVGHLVETEKEI